MRIWKRTTSFILTLALIVTMLPVSIFAEGEEPTPELPEEVIQEQENLDDNDIMPLLDDDEEEEEEDIEEVQNPYASWSDAQILAEYTRLMEAGDENSLDAFADQLSEAQQSALMAALSAMVGDVPEEQSVVASGDCGAQGSNVQWTLDADGTLTISGNGTMDDYYGGINQKPWGAYEEKIKSVIIGNGVSNVGDHAFSDFCLYLANVEISNSVTSIGKSAFANCSKLTSITIPSSVTSIGESAFSSCGGLLSITIPNSVTKIGSSAFSFCDSLENVTISNAITEIAEYTFRGCENLTKIIIPDSVTKIGSLAFSGCMSLTKIFIPSSVTTIYEGAFGSCGHLLNIVVDEDNTVYKSVDGVLYRKFQNYEFLAAYPGGRKGSFSIPDNICGIDDLAFSGCTGLIGVTIPDSVSNIGYGVFENCSSLAGIIIPDSVETIGINIFEGCTALYDVTLSTKILGNIPGNAFRDCTSLKHMVIPYYEWTESIERAVSIKQF